MRKKVEESGWNVTSGDGAVFGTLPPQSDSIM